MWVKVNFRVASLNFREKIEEILNKVKKNPQKIPQFQTHTRTKPQNVQNSHPHEPKGTEATATPKKDLTI